MQFAAAPLLHHLSCSILPVQSNSWHKVAAGTEQPWKPCVQAMKTKDQPLVCMTRKKKEKRKGKQDKPATHLYIVLFQIEGTEIGPSNNILQRFIRVVKGLTIKQIKHFPPFI